MPSRSLLPAGLALVLLGIPSWSAPVAAAGDDMRTVYQTRGNANGTRRWLMRNYAQWMEQRFPGTAGSVGMQDKASGIVNATGSDAFRVGRGVDRQIRFRSQFRAGQGTYRLSFGNPEVLAADGWRDLDQLERDLLEPRLRRYFEELAAALQTDLRRRAGRAWDEW